MSKSSGQIWRAALQQGKASLKGCLRFPHNCKTHTERYRSGGGGVILHLTVTIPNTEIPLHPDSAKVVEQCFAYALDRRECMPYNLSIRVIFRDLDGNLVRPTRL